MAYNCKVELNGVLGNDPKVIEKDGKTFVVLRMATTDSYPVKEGEQTTWKDKESLWHDVLIFKPYAVDLAKGLKKKDLLEVKGTLSYRPFKDENGYSKFEASIIGEYVQHIILDKSSDPSEDEIHEAVEVARR